MKTFVLYLFAVFVLSIFIAGCKINNSCNCFKKYFTLHHNEVSKKNHGYYYLCYIEEEPYIIQLDSVKDVFLPDHILEYNSILKVIELKVKLIDLYFSEYSRKEALNMWLNLQNTFIKEGDNFEDPQKEYFLKYKKIYLVTCQNAVIKKVKKSFRKKELLFVDHISQVNKVNYLFAINAYFLSEVPFEKMFSFDDVYKEYLMRKTKK